MLNNFLVKRKLNKLLAKYESILSDVEALRSNKDGIKSILDAQIGLLQCDLSDLGVAYDNLLYQLPTWKDRAEYIEGSKEVPNTSRLVLVRITDTPFFKEKYGEVDNALVDPLAREHKRTVNLSRYSNNGLLGDLFYRYSHLKMSKEITRLKKLTTERLGTSLFDGALDLYINTASACEMLSTLLNFLDIVNNPNEGWRPAAKSEGFLNLADILQMSKGTVHIGRVIFLPKG